MQIKERLKAARDRQKSYANNRRKPLEFSVGDKVLLKVSLRKGVVIIEGSCGLISERKWISDKRTKNQAKTNKTEHGMKKRGEAKVISKPKSKKVKVNKSQPNGQL
ncbi:hypothetical protein Tco_0888735 [Tanacetum coccineum]